MLELIALYPALRIIVLLLIFALVVGGIVVLFNALNRRAAVRGEIQKLALADHDSHAGPSLRTSQLEGAWANIAKAVESAGLNLSDTNKERLTETLRQAGYTAPSAPKVYTLIRLGLIFVLPLGYIALTYLSGEPPSFMKMYVVCTVLALLGLLGPTLFVSAKAERRKEAIVNGFPDFLDLILICIESGLGLEAAIDRVGREMAVSHPQVAELLSVTTLTLRAGASREEAFRKLADLSAVDDIRSFTTLVIQSDRLGTSISSTLRVYAAEMREKRRMRAEEKAHRLPVLISIPLVACMLPTMIGTLMLPAVVMVARQIFPLMVGR